MEREEALKDEPPGVRVGAALFLVFLFFAVAFRQGFGNEGWTLRIYHDFEFLGLVSWVFFHRFIFRLGVARCSRLVGA